MQGVSVLVKTTLPNYLSNLPVPDSFSGFFKLSFSDWLALVPPTAVCVGLGYVSYKAFFYSNADNCNRTICNFSVRKHEAKVVDMVDIENIADKAAYCRCWKTKNWPYCDGSHGVHNQRTGDNVGPLVLQKKK